MTKVTVRFQCRRVLHSGPPNLDPDPAVDDGGREVRLVQEDHQLEVGQQLGDVLLRCRGEVGQGECRWQR